MKTYLIAILIAIVSVSSNAYAQVQDDLDVVLGYDDLTNPTEIMLAGIEGMTLNSIPIFIDFFGSPNVFDPDDLATDNPGFITNDQLGPSFLVNEGDEIFVNILDASEHPASGGVGYVNFYNPAEDRIEASGRISVGEFPNNPDVPELCLDGDAVVACDQGVLGDTRRFVDTGRISFAEVDGFGIHQHIFFDLLDDEQAPTGAYAVLMEIQSDFFPVDGEIDLTSEPFWVIWNNGLSATQMQNDALPAFINASAAVPGDFDGDGDVDLADLDRYIGNLDTAATGDLEPLDLNTNGTVGSDDFQEHYEQLVETSNGGTGTFAGDINLDGTVNVLGDAFILVGSLGSSVTSWGDGDLNGDEVVDVLGDAFLLVGNLGNSNAPSN